MAKNSKIIIEESMAELEAQLRQQTFYLNKSRIKMVMFLKMFGPLSNQKIADSLGVSTSAVQKWKKTYQTNGLKGLLLQGKKQGGNL